MKKYVIEVKWAIVFTVVALLWMVFEKSMGWHDELIADHVFYSNFFSIAAIAVYVLALLDKQKNHYHGVMTWRQGFVAGLVISLLVALLTPLSQWITHEFITPDYFPNVIEYAVNSGQSTQAEAEAYFNMKNYVIQSSVFALFVGVFTAAIVALFLKRK
jgi:hypothetical protein